MLDLSPRDVAAEGRVLGRRDLLLTALLTLALAALFAATQKGRQFGDGPWITRHFVATLEHGGLWTHVLYFPVARALQGLLGFENPAQALRLVSLAGGALAGGGVFLVARAFGAGRFAATCGALLLALSRSWWFFSTLIEVHTLHLTCLTLAALLCLLGPWERPFTATLLTGLALVVLYFSHKSAVFLGPGFVALCQVGRVRKGLPPLRTRTLLLGVAPFLLVCFPFAAWCTAGMHGIRMSELVGDNAHFVSKYHLSRVTVVLEELWLESIGLVVPLFLAALLARRARDWRLLAVLAWAGPPLVFFTGWGQIEFGGYALPTAVLLVAFCALAFPARSARARALWIALLLAQGSWGLWSQLTWDAPHWARENRARAAAVERAIGPRGALLALNLRYQQVTELLPGVRETNLFLMLRKADKAGRTPEQFAEDEVARVREALERGPVALDLGFAPRLAGLPEATYVDAFRRRLAAGYALREVDDPAWPLLVVEAAD